jgi:hypothetical protein
VCCEQRRHDVNGANLGKPARGAQLAQFGGGFEPVARLDLDGRDALGDQSVEPLCRCGNQLIERR